jgi:predicted nucleotidyltransferase
MKIGNSFERKEPVFETEKGSDTFLQMNILEKTDYQIQLQSVFELSDHGVGSETFLAPVIVFSPCKRVIIFKRLGMRKIQIVVPKRKISTFCHRWKIVELGLFGSALREDFKSSSDVDVLVTFASDSQISIFDLAQMQIELEGLFGHPVDILEKEGLRNPFRKREILKTTKVIYAA